MPESEELQNMSEIFNAGWLRDSNVVSSSSITVNGATKFRSGDGVGVRDGVQEGEEEGEIDGVGVWVREVDGVEVGEGEVDVVGV